MDKILPRLPCMKSCSGINYDNRLPTKVSAFNLSNVPRFTKTKQRFFRKFSLHPKLGQRIKHEVGPLKDGRGDRTRSKPIAKVAFKQATVPVPHRTDLVQRMAVQQNACLLCVYHILH